jgi:hypothetical protein
MALFVHCKDIIPAVVALGRAAREKPKGKPKESERKTKSPAPQQNCARSIARLGINQNGKDWLGKPGVPNY